MIWGLVVLESLLHPFPVAVLGVQPRASHILGKPSATDLYPQLQSHLFYIILERPPPSCKK